MKNVMRCMALLVVFGLAAAPAFAAELRTTGFIDNVFPHFETNISANPGDNDPTRNKDHATWGRTRGRLFFNLLASDDLRGVFGIELDATYGQPRRNAAGAGCPEDVTGSGDADNFEFCGFGQNTDINNFELKHLYVDFRVPQIPIGNRTQLGGFPLATTPLHGQIILHGDFGGGSTLLTFTDRVALHLYYVQYDEDVERFPGSPKLGEDYATGTTVRLKPISGLDVHLPFIYYHGQNPFVGGIPGNSGPFHAIQNDTRNVTTESRYYLGFDARYRFGNTSIDPSFVYLLGTRNFCSPGSMVNTSGSLIPCTSPVGSRGDADYNAFVGRFLVSHTTGPWLFQAQYAYASGQDADDDINNRGIGRRADVKTYRALTTDGSPVWNDWFEILGRSEVDGTSLQTFRRWAESGTADRFGWQVLAGATEYQLTDSLILEGAVGGFWTAKKTACPANLRVGSITGACGGPLNASGEPIYNFTGNSRFMGWEVAAGFRYTILPGLTWTPRLAYADYGDAVAMNNRSPMGAWSFSNRMIYIF
jgi:Porin subfamily